MAGPFKNIGDKLSGFIDWVKEQLEDEAIRRSIADDLGLGSGDALPKPDLPADKLDSISKYRSQANPDKEAFITLLNDVKVVYEAVRAIIRNRHLDNPQLADEIVYRVFDLLAVNYARLYLPTWYFVVQALAVMVEDGVDLLDDELEGRRFLSKVGKAITFVFNPYPHIHALFSSPNEEKARATSERIFPTIGTVMSFVGDAMYGWDGPEDTAALKLSFKDVAHLAHKFKFPGDPLTQYLRQGASAQGTLFDQYNINTPPSDALLTALTDAMNKALQDPNLYDATRFKKVRLPKLLEARAAKKPTGDELTRVNKALLEAAFPDDLSLSPHPLADRIAERMLTVAVPLAGKPTDGSALGGAVTLTTAIVPAADNQHSGLLLGLGGEGAVEIALGERWKFKVEASAQPAFSLFLDFNDIKADGPMDLPLNVGIVSVPNAADVSFALPHSDGTRLEIGELDFLFSFDGHNGGLKAQARRCALVLETKDQDGFLAKILPSGGLRVPFSFGAGWSTERHFYTEGGVEWPTAGSSLPSGLPGGGSGSPSPTTPTTIAREAPAGTGSGSGSGSGGFATGFPPLSSAPKPDLALRLQIPIGKGFIAVDLDQVTLGMAPSSDPASPTVEAEASVSLTANLGPVAVKIERIGLQTRLAFPDKGGGNLGFADISLGFKAPSGAGIAIDSPFVSGGGFLAFDSEHGQYAGAIQLTVRNFATLTAIGLVTTKLPDGSKGFSFVIMITAQGFQPIQLGLGFTLTGIGGLLAINRTCNEEYLRDGIRSNALSNILFPKDVVKNAPAILGTLSNAFPMLEGSYLFGPALQICWGTPAVLTMNLGLVLELGKRHRLLILGVVSAIMPTEKHDLLRLQMNAFGVIDFDQSSISLDAVLFDSRLVGKFPITGAMALRLNWGSAPIFALSIGGFHPAFKPPPALPALERLAISFANSDDFRLRLEGYFAITSNTVQFGANLDLYAAVAGFGIEGHVGFDVLIQFDPFSFLADLHASVQIKRGTHNLLKAQIQGELSGPRPLHVRGEVSFEILWCDFTKSFDKTLIAGDPPPAPAPVVVLSQLQAALRDVRNWNGQLADQNRRMVTLREPADGSAIPLHPLGKLSVKQNVVPLNLEISRFGNATPADARLFEIKRVTLNGSDAGFDPLQDFFAPAQFLELNDEHKLTAPSFENMNAGVSFKLDSFTFTSNAGDILEDAIEYESVIIEDPNAPATPAPKLPASLDFLNRYVLFGAAGRSQLRTAVATRYVPPSGKNALLKARWGIASSEDGSAQPAPGLEAGKVVSYAEAFRVLANTKRDNPALAKTLMLRRTTVRNP